jgi:DUF4097 and DUF4098 domain-containing protein YvlB
MKTKLFVLSFIAVFAFGLSLPLSLAAQQHERHPATDTSSHASSGDNSDSDFPEKDEFHQSYQLAAGAKVEVQGINGSVEIETAAGSTAQVNIYRSARTREDLEYRKVLVDQTASSLVVHGEKDSNGAGRNREVRQRVTLSLPRQIDLGVSGVNGRVAVGEIDGPVKLSGINGKVDVAQAMGYSNISGINGRVKVTISRLGEQGIHVSGVNGGVELSFAEDLNADLDVTGINGGVNADVANVTILGKVDRQSFHAKIGSGGSPIKVNGINGHVKLSRVGAPG